jgi:hypothetical protein
MAHLRSSSIDTVIVLMVMGIGDLKRNLFTRASFYSPWNEALPLGNGTVATV